MAIWRPISGRRVFGLFFCFLFPRRAQLTAHITVIATEFRRNVVPIPSAEKLVIIARTILSVALANVVTRATARVVLLPAKELPRGLVSV